jgi:hypothetical protein
MLKKDAMIMMLGTPTSAPVIVGLNRDDKG